MSFWAYMLHCRGGYFYVGHTDYLERRIAQHQTGILPGFSADHLPVEHVWSQEFPTRDEAKAAEKQIKDWSRSKKLCAHPRRLAANLGAGEKQGQPFDKLRADGIETNVRSPFT